MLSTRKYSTTGSPSYNMASCVSENLTLCESKPKFPFLELSLDIRKKIYRHLLIGKIEFWIRDDGALSWERGKIVTESRCGGIHTNVLLLNRQVHREAAKVLYGENNFVFHMSHVLNKLTRRRTSIPSLKQLPTLAFTYIREVTICSSIGLVWIQGKAELAMSVDWFDQLLLFELVRNIRLNDHTGLKQRLLINIGCKVHATNQEKRINSVQAFVSWKQLNGDPVDDDGVETVFARFFGSWLRELSTFRRVVLQGPVHSSVLEKIDKQVYSVLT